MAFASLPRRPAQLREAARSGRALGCVFRDHWRCGHDTYLFGWSQVRVAIRPFPIPGQSRRTPAATILTHGRWTRSRGAGHANPRASV